MKHIILAIACLSFASTACSSKASPDKCNAVADHLVTLTVGAAAAEAKGSDELIASAQADQLKKQRESPQFKRMIELCQNLPEAAADCMLAAKDMKALRACQSAAQ